MKIPLSWLSEYFDTKGLSPAEISDALRFSGTENFLENGRSFEKITVGEIKKIEKHPNADRIRVTNTDVGKANGGVLQIVCGAPNIKVGQKVPVALVGATIGDFEIKEAEIRGIKSFGMLCSEKELEISDDHSGIYLLKSAATVGQALSEYLGGTEDVIDAELTPNRGDCLSVVGMARETAATFGKKFAMPKIEKPEIKTKKVINVEVIEKALCPRYVAKVIEGVKIGPSPKWMQERLISAGVRPISNVVDVTNYVMLEWGQPLHAFDGEKLDGGIIVRKAKEGEKIVTLDGQTRTLTQDDLLICDQKKPVALAGVMGGLNSEVDDQTKTVVLEAAVFDATSVRKTAQRLNLRSEASNRFEKGIPLTLPEIAIERAASLLTEIPGGLNGEAPIKKPQAGVSTDILSSWIWEQHVGLPLSSVRNVLGLEISDSEVTRILESLGFVVNKFDFKEEARKHVGKPYVFGASYKTHGDMAFDCSYLTDFIYSRIGKFVGYTSLAQFELGQSVDADSLIAGDILFVKGHIDKSATDSYFIPDNNGGYKKIGLKAPKEVGHNALYIGDGRIVHARHYDFDTKTNKWKKLPEGKVVEEGVEVFTKNPEYLGARRFVFPEDKYLAITVPWWRLDIRLKEDILEEIVRIYGLDKISAKLPNGELTGASQNLNVLSERKLKEKLAQRGLFEAISYSFVSEKLVKITSKDPKTYLKIENPLSTDQVCMRQEIWPSLLEVIAKNQDYADNFKIFEIANTYIAADSKSKENKKLCIVAFSKNSKKNFYDVKGLLESVLSEYNLEKITLEKTTTDYFAPNQAGRLLINEKESGFIGVVSDSVLNDLGIKSAVTVAEMNLSNIITDFGKKIIYKPLPKYPLSKRDINIVIPKEILVSDLEKVIASVSDQYLMSFQVVDIYEGNNLPEGKKSVTIGLVIGSSEKTLSEEDISESQKNVVSILTQKVGGVLRS